MSQEFKDHVEQGEEYTCDKCDKTKLDDMINISSCNIITVNHVGIMFILKRELVINVVVQ